MPAHEVSRISLTALNPWSDARVLEVLNIQSAFFSTGGMLHPQESSVLARTGAILRPWVDEWIETAVSSNGVEDPSKRTWPSDRTGGMYSAVVSYSERNLRLWLAGSSLGAFIMPPDELSSIKTEKDVRGLCEYLAFRVMASELRFRISRCLDCGIYFLRSHRRGVRKRSPRCESCYSRYRGKDSVEIGKRNRQAKRNDVYAFIANEFSQEIGGNANWFKDPELVEEIVQAVNTQVRRKKLDHESITTKWVLRGVNPDHRGAIARSACALLRRRKGTPE